MTIGTTEAHWLGQSADVPEPGGALRFAFDGAPDPSTHG